MLYVCSGGTGFRSFQSNNILEFDINKREWTIVGKLTHATQDMGVSEVDFADFEPWCQNDTLASWAKQGGLPADSRFQWGIDP